MATPRRNTVDYFPHLIGYGKKMDFIEKRHGNDGYATWFKILETLATTDNHFLNLNDPIEVSFLSSKCNIDEYKLSEIISDLVKIKVFDKELWEHKVLWSQTFFENIQDAYKRRATKPINMHTLCIHLVDTMVLPKDFKHSTCKQKKSQSNNDVYENPHIILDDIIVDESILESEEEKKSPTQNFSPSFGKQPIEILKKKCAAHSSWLDSVGMKNSLLPDQVLEWFNAFCLHILSTGKTEETESEFKRYCSSWISSEIRQGRTIKVEPPPEKSKPAKVNIQQAFQKSITKEIFKEYGQ